MTNLAKMSTSMLLLSAIVAVLLTTGQCQDLQRFRQRLEERKAYMRLTGEEKYPHIREEVAKATDAINKLWTTFFPQLLENLSNLSEENATISIECINSTMHILENPENTTMPNILPLIDATGKQEAGILSGNMMLISAFDECFEYDYTGLCYATNVQLSSTPFSWSLVGLCVPKYCTASDVEIVLNSTGVVTVDQGGVACANSKMPDYSPGSIAMIAVCALFVSLVLVGTLVDQVPEYITIIIDAVKINDNSEKAPLLRHTVVEVRKPVCKVGGLEFITAFSLYKTVPTLLATKQAPGVITCLNGLRVISMFWVILGHTQTTVLQQLDNPIKIGSILSRFSFQAVGNGTFSVDSFFFLSGVLVAYLSLRQMKKKGRFPFVHYYVHRYLRLTPTYAFVLFFAWFLTTHIAPGPSLSLTSVFAEACSKYWWTNLLYINNLYPWKLDDQCVPWTWYLANDMQFYIIAPLIFISAYYLFPVGLIMATGLLVGSFTISSALEGVFNFPTNLLTPPDQNITQTYNDVIYTKPWSRIPTYIVGLLLGYILYEGIRLPFGRIKNTPFYLAMWAVSAVLCVSTLYGLYPSYHGHVPSIAENVLYVTFSRFVWGLGLALLVFACHNGYGWLINTFLSMKIWTPLSRMTFNAYLVHPIVVVIAYGQLQKTVHYTDITMATFTVAFVVLSYAVAAVVCVCVELPLGTIEMLLFKLIGLGGRESQRQGTSNEKTENEKKTLAQGEA